MKKNVTPEFVVVYRVDGIDDRGMGDMSFDKTILVTQKQLEAMIAKQGTTWIKKIYKLGNEVQLDNEIEYIEVLKHQ